MKVVRSGDGAWTPWKNGGGLTRQIAVFPEAAGFDSFEWRISTAHINCAGPFSRFDGIDRSLTVLVGRLELLVDHAPAVALTTASPPLSFAGEAVIDGLPLGPEVIDFNVMTRRSSCRHEVARLYVADRGIEAIPTPAPGEWTMAHIVSGTARIYGGKDQVELQAADTLILNATDRSVTLSATADCSLILAHIRRLRRAATVAG